MTRRYDYAIASLVGTEVARQREARGWTRAELARQLPIEAPHLRRVELGLCSPSLPCLCEIADALGTTVASLVAVLDEEESHAA